MQDVIYVAAMVAFFALAALFVVGCDKIVGSDEAALAQAPAPGNEPEHAEEKLAA